MISSTSWPYFSGKEACVGKVYMLSLSSQPVDHEDQNKVKGFLHYLD